MSTLVPIADNFLVETEDASYYQETFYFTMLVGMSKDYGGSRDETKNDIRALPEVLTVTLVEREKGGVQKDLGTKYLSTLKIHVRKPREVSKDVMMKRIVKMSARLKGVSVLRWKEKKPTQRKKVFRGPGSYKITEQDYQASPVRQQRNRQGWKKITQTGPNDSGPYKQVKDDPEWKSAPPGAVGGLEETEELDNSIVKNKDLSRFDRLREEILIAIGGDSDLMAFDIQPDLNQKIWNHSDSVRPGVKGALMGIVDEFMEGLDLGIDPDDVIITGSIANYNWSKFSDIDLHILLDFKGINDNEELVKHFFDAVRSNWNKLHDIRVKGHEVEIYVQDINEPHISTGVYSLVNDRWLVTPKKVKPQLDRATSTKKMLQYGREIDKLAALYDSGSADEAFALATKLKEKIKKMRRAGLDRTGIYSPENLAFKMLRRSGDIEQLFSIYTKAYDEIHSLDQ